METNNQYKQCKSCGQNKELIEFFNYKLNEKTYYKTKCRHCQYLKNKAKWAKNPEIRKAYVKKQNDKYCRNKPEQVILNQAKQRAKKRQLDFNIDVSDIIIPNTCPVLGIQIRHAYGTKRKSDNSPSLDRIDNSLGYLKGNVCIISDRANRIKNDATIEELEKVIAYMRGKNQSV